MRADWCNYAMIQNQLGTVIHKAEKKAVKSKKLYKKKISCKKY
jgi:hypothetical protein